MKIYLSIVLLLSIILNNPFKGNTQTLKVVENRQLSGVLTFLEEIVSSPFVYKPKYDFTLFPRKNKQGKYQNWPEGQVVELTLVRYNRYFEDGKELITIVTDIKPLDSILPVMHREIDTAFMKSLYRKLF